MARNKHCLPGKLQLMKGNIIRTIGQSWKTLLSLICSAKFISAIKVMMSWLQADVKERGRKWT